MEQATEGKRFIDWVWDVIKVYRHGNLRTRTPVTTVERFLTEQTELMKQMEKKQRTPV